VRHGLSDFLYFYVGRTSLHTFAIPSLRDAACSNWGVHRLRSIPAKIFPERSKTPDMIADNLRGHQNRHGSEHSGYSVLKLRSASARAPLPFIQRCLFAPFTIASIDVFVHRGAK
jgi:hypothetical protein